MAGTPKSFFLSPEVHDYLLRHGGAPDTVAAGLIAETEALGGISRMQIAPEQGAFITLLTRLVGAQRAIEVGTFTGYSALCIARGLAEGGHLLCCDVSREWTSVGRPYWEKAGVADRIELRIGPAADTLRELPVQRDIDIAFIDADKDNYQVYFDELVPRMRHGGVILVDNVLWGGAVADTSNEAETTRIIRDFNQRLERDPRVEGVMLPIGDGLTLARVL